MTTIAVAASRIDVLTIHESGRLSVGPESRSVAAALSGHARRSLPELLASLALDLGRQHTLLRCDAVRSSWPEHFSDQKSALV